MGSLAMLAEAIHTTADTGNELLLFLSLRRSRKAPDDTHPLGHGRELCCWSLIVAVFLFSAGASMSIYEGLTNLSHPSELKSVGRNYMVLGFAFVADGNSWTIVFRQLLKQKRVGESFWRIIRTCKEPSVFIVFGEDRPIWQGYWLPFWGYFWGNVFIAVFQT
jgi:Predicted Co/Zn/Cd cation transporters